MICTWNTLSEHAAVVRLDGDLDYTSADYLVELVSARLGATRTLRLDCASLELCDSSGLSALLMVRRITDDAGASLWLDNRGRALDRLLEVTGTRSHLIGAAVAADEGSGGDA